MRYSLRTLVIVMMLGGPLCAWGWKRWDEYRNRPAPRIQTVALEAVPLDSLEGPVGCGISYSIERAEERERRRKGIEAEEFHPVEIYYLSDD